MSSQEGEENPEMKGGHLPAVKIGGGVRVHQHRARKESDKGDEKKDKEEVEEMSPIDDQKVVVSGVVTKGDKDFPPEAVKAFHEKPKPTHQMPHTNPSFHIQQPRKQ